jgi:glycosyltransferase involved in cell wall biosynthesis
VRIGIVTTWFERGAAYVSRQYRDLLANDHDVFIYARGGESYARGDPRWDDERVTWARSIPTHGNTAFRLGHFQRWLRRSRPDLVLFNEQHWWPPVLLCQDLGLRTAAYVDYYTEKTVELFGNYDLLLCHTRRHRSVFDWHPACHHIPWGTQIDLFDARSLEPAAPGKITFFHSAGISPVRKGTDILLDAFANLGESPRLVIHAQDRLADRLPHRRARIEQLLATGRLELHERSAPPPGLYSLGDVYVYPTRLEGIGLTIAEALASGLPVIVPDAPPMSEFIDAESCRAVEVDRFLPRSDGYYWPQSMVDPADLARHMEWYCARLDRIGELKRAARSHAERKLDWQRNAAGLGACLEQVERLKGEDRERARRAALAFERNRVDLSYFYPWLSRAMFRAADLLQPLSSRYSGRRPAGGSSGGPS